MGDEEADIEIRINRQRFRIPRRALTGADLRQLSTPPIGPDQDLFQMGSPGAGGDVLIVDQQTVDFDTSVEFFSTPRHILAGRRSRTSTCCSSSSSLTGQGGEDAWIALRRGTPTVVRAVDLPQPDGRQGDDQVIIPQG
jgi:hypothetical protein